MGSSTELLACATWRPAVSGIRAGTAGQQVRRRGGGARMDRGYPPYPGILWTPPYGGPIWSPGLSGPEVHGLVHPGIPSGRPCALFPAFLGLRYRCPRLYTTTSWGGASWLCQLGGSRGPSVLGWVLGWDLGWGPRPGGSRSLWE